MFVTLEQWTITESNLLDDKLLHSQTRFIFDLSWCLTSISAIFQLYHGDKF